MHNEVIAHEAGLCPLCNMVLVFVEGELDLDVSGEYYCPMHPDVSETSPGNCPVCDMNLVKKEA